MKLKKIDVKSKSFITLSACLVLAVGAVAMVGVSQMGKSNLIDEKTTTAVRTTDANANVTGVKNTTKKVETTTAPSSTEATQPEKVTLPADDTNIPFKSSYTYPLTDALQKPFSNGELVFSQTMGDYRSHNGTDFDGKENDKVKSINAGLVMNITKDDLWGTVIEMDHGNKMVVRYCGMKETKLKIGDFVQQGDVIGTLGAIPIESADGTHLHLEVRIEDKIADPIKAMNKGNLN